MKDFKNIDIKTLKLSEKKLLLKYLKIHYLYKYLMDKRLNLRNKIEDVFTKLDYKQDFRVVDNENEIATLFQWVDCDW